MALQLKVSVYQESPYGGEGDPMLIPVCPGSFSYWLGKAGHSPASSTLAPAKGEGCLVGNYLALPPKEPGTEQEGAGQIFLG